MIHLYEERTGDRKLVAKATLDEMLSCGVAEFFRLQNMVGRHDYEYVPEEDENAHS